MLLLVHTTVADEIVFRVQLIFNIWLFPLFIGSLTGFMRILKVIHCQVKTLNFNET